MLDTVNTTLLINRFRFQVLIGVLFVMFGMIVAGCSSTQPDAISSATHVMTDTMTPPDTAFEPRILIIMIASDNGATAKVAQAMAEVLGARIMSPEYVDIDEIMKYELVGFGSGIFSQRHHRSLFDLIEKFPVNTGQKAFIFSTSGMSRQFALDHKTADTHSPLRDALQAKGLSIIGEFNCEGFNDNSFLKFFGGMNKGRPNSQDLLDAECFAKELKHTLNEPHEPQKQDAILN